MSLPPPVNVVYLCARSFFSLLLLFHSERLKMIYLHKANEQLLWARFLLFSSTLYPTPLCTLVLSNLLFSSFRQTVFFLSSLASISFMLLSGVQPVRLRVLWESRAPLRDAPSWAPLRSHSWPQGLNIEWELRPWQKKKKNRGWKRTQKEGRKIDFRKKPQRLVAQGARTKYKQSMRV